MDAIQFAAESLAAIYVVGMISMSIYLTQAVYRYKGQKTDKKASAILIRSICWPLHDKWSFRRS